MNSNKDDYVKARQEMRNLLSNFKNIKSLYGMIHHMRGKYMTDKSAADFYQLILENIIGRDIASSSRDSKLEKEAFDEIFNKCEGLFTYFEKGEKQIILNELKRLQEIN